MRTFSTGAPKAKQGWPLRRFVLNLLLVLAVSAWLFFNYERIPGMLLSLWRAISGWITALIDKI